MKRLINATIHSLRGLRYTIAHEAAVRQEVIVLAFGGAARLLRGTQPGLVCGYDRRGSHFARRRVVKYLD